MHLGLPGNTQDLEATFAFRREGDTSHISGSIDAFDLDLGGARLKLRTIEISDAGLRTASAELFAPTLFAQQVDALVTLKQVVITREGLTIDGGTADFKLPDLRMGKPLAITGLHGQVTAEQQTFALKMSGVLAVALPGITSNGPVSLALRRDAQGAVQLSGEVASLTLSLGGGTLVLSRLALNNAGLTVASGKLTLPTAGLTDVAVQKIAIRTSNCSPTAPGAENCLSIGSGSAGLNLPVLPVGGAGSVFSIRPRSSTLRYDNGVFAIDIAGMLAANLPGNTVAVTGSVTLDSSGGIGGTIGGFDLRLAGGLEVSVMTSTLDDDTGLSAERAWLRLPDGLGGAGAGLERLRIDLKGGLNVGGGKFTLPPINTGIGGFRIAGAEGQFGTQTVGGQTRYIISGAGTFGVDYLAEPDISFTISFTSLNDVLLQNACLGIRSLNPAFPGVPLGPPGMPVYITGVKGCVNLSPQSTTINLTVTVEALPEARINGLSPLWGTIGAEYKTAGDPAIMLAGAIHAYAFELASASVKVARTRFDIDITAQVSFQQIATGSLRAHLWYDNSLHFTGSAETRVRGSAVPILGPYISWFELAVRLDVGEFRQRGVIRSGVKGTLEVAKASGYLFVGLNGHVEGGWGDGDLALADQRQLAGLTRRMGLAADGTLANGLGYASTVEPDATTTVTLTREVTRTTPLLIDLTWKSGDPLLALRRPDGTPVVAGDGVTVVNQVGHAGFLIDTPAAGTWTIVISNLQGTEDYRLETRSFYQPRTLATVSLAPGDPPVVQWALNPGETKPAVSVWIERDDSGFASAFTGEMVADVVDGTSLPIDTSRLPSGTYHVYVQLDDGMAGIDRKYADQTFQVANDGPPAAPTGLSARMDAEGLHLMWQPPVAHDLGGYRLGISTSRVISGTTEEFTETITLPALAPGPDGLVRYALRRPAGTTNVIRIQAVDMDGQASAFSASATATTSGLLLDTLAPATGSAGVSRTGPFTATFNLDLDQESVITSSVRLRDSQGTLINVRVAPLHVAGDAEQIAGIVSTPVTALLQGEVYTLTIAGGVGGIHSTSGATLGDSVRAVYVTEAAPPIPAYTVPDPLVANTPFTITNTTTGPGQTRYIWDFGDGSQSDALNPSYSYQAAGTYTITLTATGPGGSRTLARPVQVVEQSTSGAVAQVEKTGRLVIDADHDGKLTPGDTIEWVIWLRSMGAQPLVNWRLTDALMAGTRLVPGSATATDGTVSISGNTVEASGAQLAPGAETLLALQSVVNLNVSGTIAAIANQAILSADNHPNVNSDDPATDTLGDATSLALEHPTVAATLTKTGSMVLDADRDGKLTPGDTIGWTITLRNTGVGPIFDWSLGDTIDASTSLVTGTASSTLGNLVVAGNTLTVMGGVLAPSASAVLTLRSMVGSDVTSSVDSITNQATLRATNHPDLNSDDPSTSAATDATTLVLDQPEPEPTQRRTYLPVVIR